MKIQELTETFDNIFLRDNEKRQKYGQQIYDLLTIAYKPLGGLKGNGFESVQSMIEKIPFWKIYRNGNEIKAVILYKDKSGRKAVAMATNGSKDGKYWLGKMIQDEYRFERGYIEISGPLLSFYHKLLGPELNRISIPAKEAPKLLGLKDSNINIINDYEYERNIGNHWITKRLVGYPGKKIIQK